MGKPAYIAVDSMLTAVSITGVPLQDATLYPADKVGNGILGDPTFLQLNGGAIEGNIDASSFISYDTVFVGNHTLRSTGTFSVYGGTTTPAPTPLASAAWRAHDMWVAVGTQTTRNYVSVQLVQADGVLGDPPIQVGEIVIGQRVLFPRAPTWGIVKQQEDIGITMESIGGVVSDYELSSYRTLRPTFRFPESEYATFLAFSDAVGRDPFVYIPNVDAVDAYYVRKERGFHPTPIGPAMDGSVLAHWYDWTLYLRTESEGLTVNP